VHRGDEIPVEQRPDALVPRDAVAPGRDQRWPIKSLKLATVEQDVTDIYLRLVVAKHQIVAQTKSQVVGQVAEAAPIGQEAADQDAASSHVAGVAVGSRYRHLIPGLRKSSQLQPHGPILIESSTP
jgi:hypothetical protein